MLATFLTKSTTRYSKENLKSLENWIMLILSINRIVFSIFSGHKAEQISRCYGFVKFKNDADAIEAHKALNNKEFYGKEWMIQFSKRDKPRAETPGRYLGHKKK